MVGEKWQNINEVAGPYVKDFAIAAVCLAVFYFIVKKLTKKRG